MALLANDEWRLDPKLKKYFLKMFDNQSAGCQREKRGKNSDWKYDIILRAGLEYNLRKMF